MTCSAGVDVAGAVDLFEKHDERVRAGGRGHIKGLIFSKLARLARNTKELLDFAETFQKQVQCSPLGSGNESEHQFGCALQSA